jgi:TMEM70/TMEM186/TMEM223 protein family
MVPVYRAGWQLVKVRALMALSLAVLALCLWWGLDLARTYGLSPGDGGVLALLPQRLAWGGLVALFGVAIAAGMGLYGRRYVARIGFDPDRRQIHLDTAGFFGTNRHVTDLADLGSVRAHRDVNRGDLGEFVGHPTPTVNAPWMSVRIAGWRLPLIIDQQGEVLDRKLLRTMWSGRGPR